MRRFTRSVVAIAAAFAFILPLGGCGEQTAAEQAQEQQDAANEKPEEDLGKLADSGGWRENEERFTEGEGTSAKHYVVQTTGEFHCSPKFLLVDKDNYELVEIVPGNKHTGGVLLKDLPPEFAAAKKNLTRQTFNQLIEVHRGSSKELGLICTNRP